MVDSFFRQPLTLKSMLFKIETDNSIDNWSVNLNGQAVKINFSVVENIVRMDFDTDLLVTPGSYLEVEPLQNNYDDKGYVSMYLLTDDLQWSLPANSGRWLSLNSLNLTPLGAALLDL